MALLFTDTSASQLHRQAQLGTMLFDVSALELDESERLRFALDEAEAKATAAEKAAADARKVAAEQLEESKALKKNAEDLRAQVAKLVQDRDAAAKAAEVALQQEEAAQAQMEAENAAVEKRIQERLAQAEDLDGQIAERNQRLEEERKRREAEAAAQRKAAAEAREREAQAQREQTNREKQRLTSSRSSKSTLSSGSSSNRTKTSRSSNKTSTKTSSAGFMLPMNGRVTSRFGMRLHPVTGVYKLHDGTDYAGSCGTPLRAAADGVVVEKYYNAGYGNRLMIDHGKVGGVNVTTGLNHAIRYTVGVGQRVSKGQVVGYTGTTGYSTGCHLHLMVWENGRLVNPQARWF